MKTYSDDNVEAILSRGEELLDYMTDRHNKVLVLREDHHFPRNGYSIDGGNAENSLCQKRVNKAIEEELGCETVSLWARERTKRARGHHYHGLRLLDGSKIQSPDRVLKIIQTEWDKIVNGQGKALVHYCRQERNEKTVPGSVMIRRESKEASGEVLEEQKRKREASRAEADYMMSYLAKSYSKETDLPKGTRMFGSSQIVSAQKKKRPVRVSGSKPKQESDDSPQE